MIFKKTLNGIGIIFCIVFCLLHGSDCFSQVCNTGGCVRVAVLGGGNVNFVFNNMQDYKNGITYTNWTLLGITATQANPAPPNFDNATWTLDIQAAGPNFVGVNPANTLPLTTIQTKAIVSAGCATCNVFGSPFQTLTAAPVVLATGTLAGDQLPDSGAGDLNFGTDQIAITYTAGKNPLGSLLGKAADYYSVDVWFTAKIF